MNATTLSLHSETRPEAMADVPGICELPLTRAVVHYRDLHEVDLPGGRIQDIGLALVLEGRFASSAEVLDLGSSTVKMLDLSSELVVLDWVYEPTLEHVNRLLREKAEATQADVEGTHLGSYCLKMALSLLGRVGFGPLTRPTILRIGFRDICRDLDLHEGTSVRILVGENRITRAHLDYDANALVFRVPSPEPDVMLEGAVLESFPENEVLRLSENHDGASISYQVRLPLPTSLSEARSQLQVIRLGLGKLLARFEPGRFQTVEQQLSTFGCRETLGQLHIRERHMQATRLRAHVAAQGDGTVH